MNPVKNNKKIDILSENLSRRIVILDGAMGTMIQRLKLKEVDFRGKKFADHNTDVLGNNDLLNISNPKTLSFEDLPVEETLRNFFENPKKYLK